MLYNFTVRFISSDVDIPVIMVRGAMEYRKDLIKQQIITALLHPEAEEGLYFRNFTILHEEDERPAVEGDQLEILEALRELIDEHRVRVDETGKEVVFFAAQ